MAAEPDRERYVQYEPGHSLRKMFPQDKIPLMQMEHLRQLDFMIGRGLSYEGTVNSFLQQLYLNESMRPLKMRDSMVILLDREGALVQDGGIWSLIFAPEERETLSLSPEEDLFPIYEEMLGKVDSGEMSRIVLPQISERALLNNTGHFVILDTYARQQSGGYLSVAKELVKNGTDRLFSHVPVLKCGALSTLDVNEIESYNTIRELIQDYVLQYDSRTDGSPIQPLSVAVFGAPGSGKSFGIKELAKSIGRFRIATLNCSQFESIHALFAALDAELQETKNETPAASTRGTKNDTPAASMKETRNTGTGGEESEEDKPRIPLIFFDEFDSSLNGVDRGWLKYFLAPMQDGEYTLNGRTRTIDAAVFIFAGGTAETFAQFVPKDADGEAAFRNAKGPDFISRLKGTLDIKGPNAADVRDRRHIIRRALLLRELIIRKFPAVYDEKTGQINISGGLLSSLLRVSEYRHGARSIEFILAMSRLAGEKRFTPSCLPPMEQLDIHLDIRDFSNKIMFEQMIGDGLELLAKRIFENALTEKGEKPDWALAGEDVREHYRGRIRFLGERLVDPRSSIGVRRIIPEAPDSIAVLEGKDLETFSDWFQQAYVQEKITEGWKYDAVEDDELLRSPFLVSYSQLPDEKKTEIQTDIAKYIKYLRGLGFELFRRPYHIL